MKYILILLALLYSCTDTRPCQYCQDFKEGASVAQYTGEYNCLAGHVMYFHNGGVFERGE